MPTVVYSSKEYAAIVAENSRLKAQLEHCESMRPIWAQGHSSDSMAAQAMAGALNQLWQLLGATNQSEAMALLHQLKA